MHFEEELESDAKNSTPILQQISILDCILQELSLSTNEALQIWIRAIVLYIFFAIRPLTIIKKKTLSIYFSASNTTTTEHSNNGDKKFLASTISQQPTSTEINTTAAATTTNTSVPTQNKQSRKFRENVMLKTALENAATITPQDNKDEDADQSMS